MALFKIFLFRFVHSLNTILIKKNTFKICAVQGDHIGDHILVSGIYEGEYLKIIYDTITDYGKSALKKKVILDIGANIGNHSLAFSTWVEQVYSFEPNPATYKILEANILLNRIENIHTYNIGLSSKSLSAILYESTQNNLGEASLIPKIGSSTFPIQLVNGDSYLKEMSGIESENIVLVKIDVEGHEEDVIIGLEGTLKSGFPTVVFEAHTDERAQCLVDKLRSYGYNDFGVISYRYKMKDSLIKKLICLLIFGRKASLYPLDDFNRGYYPCIVAWRNT